MSIKSLQSILKHQKPAFACYACGDKTKTEAFIAAVHHEVGDPASKKSLSLVPSVPGSKVALDFYSKHDGVLLYSGRGLLARRGENSEGIEIFRIEEWSTRTEESVENWEEAGYEDEEMPYGRNDFVAIAHARGASTYIHWVIDGPAKGQVWWWASTNPPGKDASPIAASFRGFIDLICNEPVRFLNEISYCYTRFSDRKTDIQWILIRYIPDVRAEM